MGGRSRCGQTRAWILVAAARGEQREDQVLVEEKVERGVFEKIVGAGFPDFGVERRRHTSLRKVCP